MIVLLSIIGVQNFSYNVCNAKLPRGESYLGGIWLGGYNGDYCRYDTVVKIYGKPTTEKNLGTGFGTIMYGNSVTIGFGEGVVDSIEVTANNGWKTPSGLGVGMKINDAERMYGEPDSIKTNGNKILYVYDGLYILANRNDGKIIYLGLHGGGNIDEGYYTLLEERLLK